MEIFPAIDLHNGQAVRLLHGDYNQVTVYSERPWEVAADFLRQGANHLHVVDLDGAKDGSLANFSTIEKIRETDGLFIQVGGGIRNKERIDTYLSLGVDRVILGTAALEQFDFLCEMVALYGEKIAVGVDARDGRVAVKGWLETSDTDSISFCKKLADAGVKTIIYTDISRDGAQKGANLPIYETLQKTVPCNIIASGGVSFPEEIEKLKSAGVYGAILGKALYTGMLDLKQVLALAK